ncbi:MAG: hypothetical protein N2A40_01185, partial [Desulfobulbaceae bacterium]
HRNSTQKRPPWAWPPGLPEMFFDLSFQALFKNNLYGSLALTVHCIFSARRLFKETASKDWLFL